MVPARVPRSVQRLRQQLHGRGLAVGAGDADHGHRARRRAVEAVGRVSPRRARRPGTAIASAGARQLGRRRRLEQDRAARRRPRLLDEAQAVRAEAGDARRRHRPACTARLSMHQAGDRQVGAARRPRPAAVRRRRMRAAHRAPPCVGGARQPARRRRARRRRRRPVGAAVGFGCAWLRPRPAPRARCRCRPAARPSGAARRP